MNLLIIMTMRDKRYYLIFTKTENLLLIEMEFPFSLIQHL